MIKRWGTTSSLWRLKIAVSHSLQTVVIGGFNIDVIVYSFTMKICELIKSDNYKLFTSI